MHKYFAKLKVVYTNLISRDDYPSIGWLQFTAFCKEADVFDEKCKMADVDRCFVVTNYEEEDIPENPDRALNRYEFLEILVRIADIKYK